LASIQPLRGLYYNNDVVKFGRVLAPPYDVIDDAEQEALYGRALRNIVRIDFGEDYEGDIPGSNDRYTRAYEHLHSWVNLGVLKRDEQPSMYLHEHSFIGSDGVARVRRGIFCRVLAKPWEQSEVRPHERTHRGPKEDRMRLMESIRTQTSAVFMVWRGGDDVEPIFDEISAKPVLLAGDMRNNGKVEGNRVWRVDTVELLSKLSAALHDATLYIADGHHRYETAAAYAQRQREAGGAAPDPADFDYTLAYICAWDTDGVELLPTHRLVKPRENAPTTLNDVVAKAGEGWTCVPTDDLDGAVRASAIRQPTHHAFAFALRDECGMIARPRSDGGSARDRLDVVVLEEQLLNPAGIDANKGDVTYTRDPGEVATSVKEGSASLGVVLNSMGVDEVLAVADAADVMPQKSTYFDPKVPTGIVLSPL
jgi:uncharacterized protein (DUF1015 family)